MRVRGALSENPSQQFRHGARKVGEQPIDEQITRAKANQFLKRRKAGRQIIAPKRVGMNSQPDLVSSFNQSARTHFSVLSAMSVESVHPGPDRVHGSCKSLHPTLTAHC